MVRPRIGVCLPDKGGFIPWMFFWFNIHSAGGNALRITPNKPRKLSELDGLVAGGGADIDPGLYGGEAVTGPLSEEWKETSKSSRFRDYLSFAAASATYGLRRLFGLKQAPHDARKRDDLEAPLIRAALDAGVPILGVCRGMQLMNVVLGGTLHQEIADVYEDVGHPYTVFPHKAVTVDEDTRLAGIVGRTQLRVNAMHHQSVDAVGRGLRVAAQDEYGIIEALELEGDRFALGVQWHPEFMPQMSSQRRIFKAFISACAARKKTAHTI